MKKISVDFGIIEDNRLVAKLTNGCYIRTSQIKDMRIVNDTPIIDTQNSTYEIDIAKDSILYDVILSLTVSKQ